MQHGIEWWKKDNKGNEEVIRWSKWVATNITYQNQGWKKLLCFGFLSFGALYDGFCCCC